MAEANRAEASLMAARRAVDGLTSVGAGEQSPADESELQPARLGATWEAVAYYQKFIADHEGDSELRPELAAAQARLGQLTGQLGAVEQGITIMQKSICAISRTPSRQTNAIEYERHIAEALQVVADFHDFLGKPDQAMAANLDAVRTLGKVAKAEPDNAALMEELAVAYLRLANTQYFVEDEINGPQRSIRIAVTIFGRLATERPGCHLVSRAVAEAATIGRDRLRGRELLLQGAHPATGTNAA